MKYIEICDTFLCEQEVESVGKFKLIEATVPTIPPLKYQ